MTKNKIIIIIALLSFSKSFSQEFFLTMGKNYSSFEFTSSNADSNLSYRTELGEAYAVGYELDFNKSSFAYQISLTYNQFNASASNGATNYAWNTSYLGLQNTISYSLTNLNEDIQLFFNAGLNTTTILRGDQFVNTFYYDLKKQEEFSGIILQPLIGLNMKYAVSDNLKLSLGYHFSKSFNVTNSTDEKLSFLNNQIKLGLHFPLN
jgi:opacity protein-like surface antigen